VGDDDRGEKIRQAFVAENIAVTGLTTRRQASSQLAFIAVEQTGGSRTIFWKRPSGEPLRADELGRNFLDGTDFLHLDGLMGGVSLYAAQEARARRIPVMVDAGRMRPGMLELARNCDYVVASEQFARDISPYWESNLQNFMKELAALGLPMVTVTQGERGSITFSHGEIMRISALPVQAVDTTGAGDVFHGGYIYGLLQGWELCKTVRFASAMAALKCTRIGGRDGIPALPEIRQFLNGHGSPLPG
jgi:ribokinase